MKNSDTYFKLTRPQFLAMLQDSSAFRNYIADRFYQNSVSDRIEHILSKGMSKVESIKAIREEFTTDDYPLLQGFFSDLKFSGATPNFTIKGQIYLVDAKAIYEFMAGA